MKRTNLPEAWLRGFTLTWVIAVLSLCVVAQVSAQPAHEEARPPTREIASDYEALFQSTYIWQRKPGFSAPYTGPNSVIPESETSYTFSATAFLGARLLSGTEVYINPEIIQGAPLSNLTGFGSPTNAEIQKVAGPNPKLYIPRGFVRHTWGLGGEKETVASAFNQLAGERDRHRIVATAGKFAINDVFDVNSYAHDPRTQFLTWATVTHGAYDFAADAQGFTWGLALEYVRNDWAFRIGRFLGPQDSNGLELNTAIMRYHGDQFEVQHDHQIAGRPGSVRFIVWNNREDMGRFDEAIEYANINGGTPEVANVRRSHNKHGYGLHFEQSIAHDVGAFVRYSWGDGQTETYSFQEVERSLQAGLSIKGSAWQRAADTLGVLWVRNGLSSVHRRYLELGGLGFFIGDGQLNYRPEQIFETYYNINLHKAFWLGVDYQRIVNPAYNADRGPVNVYGARLHTEF